MISDPFATTGHIHLRHSASAEVVVRYLSRLCGHDEHGLVATTSGSMRVALARFAAAVARALDETGHPVRRVEVDAWLCPAAAEAVPSTLLELSVRGQVVGPGPGEFRGLTRLLAARWADEQLSPAIEPRIVAASVEPVPLPAAAEPARGPRPGAAPTRRSWQSRRVSRGRRLARVVWAATISAASLALLVAAQPPR
jgi:hypothetical protein